MHLQIVMDTSGDNRHQFHPDDASALAEAEKRFDELIGTGFIAAKRTGNGTSELVSAVRPFAGGHGGTICPQLVIASSQSRRRFLYRQPPTSSSWHLDIHEDDVGTVEFGAGDTGRPVCASMTT
jgi:hypothetical protein